MNQPLTAKIIVNAPLGKVWELWTNPEHILHWNAPSGEWYTENAVNDLTADGSFCFKMKAHNDSDGFDYKGTYNEIIPMQKISATLSDGRRATNLFTASGNSVTITETFDPEPGLSAELQKYFCQNVLENFKKYVESQL
jgi:uncharacterized protein YndB with AHSA1/START domain